MKISYDFEKAKKELLDLIESTSISPSNLQAFFEQADLKGYTELMNFMFCDTHKYRQTVNELVNNKK